MTRRHAQGFTLVELIVIVSIVAVLSGILLPVLAGSKRQARASICLSNLKQLGTGFHLFADDNRGYLPSEQQEMLWVDLLRPYLSAGEVFMCPADPDADFGVGLSYSWRDSLAVDDPAASLAGRKLTMARPDELVMVFDDLPGWHGSGDIQASALDTSARRHRYDAFEQNLAIVLQ